MPVSSSMILIYVQGGPPGGRGAEGDLICILHPHHRRPHPEMMVKPGCLLSEALGTHLGDQ